MDKDALRKAVAASLIEVAPNVDPATLDPAKSFRDQIEFDSIDQLNFVLALQETLGIEVPELDYPQLAGLDAAADYLSSHLGSTA
jgi:acyl carrier protein